MDKLNETMIEQALEAVTDWSLNGESIQRTFTHEDFMGSMAFVQAVAELAEAAQHHPDILIRWNKVTLTLSTHDAGGLTERDFLLAKSIDQLA
ncbi:MAG: 4a-hydroxytetrahydrobiopterin dehydratase [Phycisphaerae bacterium]|nr:4a-hydroxytetrahydrobiopterin dehydratase [Phycisphaerae bacterium]